MVAELQIIGGHIVNIELSDRGTHCFNVCVGFQSIFEVSEAARAVETCAQQQCLLGKQEWGR